MGDEMADISPEEDLESPRAQANIDMPKSKPTKDLMSRGKKEPQEDLKNYQTHEVRSKGLE